MRSGASIFVMSEGLFLFFSSGGEIDQDGLHLGSPDGNRRYRVLLHGDLDKGIGELETQLFRLFVDVEVDLLRKHVGFKAGITAFPRELVDMEATQDAIIVLCLGIDPLVREA